MSERQRDGYVVKGELSHTEDLNKNYISQIIDYVEFIIKHVPFLVEGEELRGEYQESYREVLGKFIRENLSVVFSRKAGGSEYSKILPRWKVCDSRRKTMAAR